MALFSRHPSQKTFNQIIDKIYHGTSPYSGFPNRRYVTDTQGWNSEHTFLSSSIKKKKPKIVLEVGVWKGGSVIHMAKTIRDCKYDGVVIAIDTFLGSWDHWNNEKWLPELIPIFGYPSMYYTFLANIVATDLQGYVIPLPLDSSNASFVISHNKIVPELIHIDGSHDYESVFADLKRWWAILAPGGVIICDDYDINGVIWQSVRHAVDDFLKETKHTDFEALSNKCRFRKPLK
jgi:cephalosporin hydroxylase